MISFFIAAVPRGQARPRHTRAGITYKTKEQVADERTLEALMLPHRPNEPLQGPLLLSIVASMPIPKSWTKKRKVEWQQGRVWPVTKPDVDNILKNIADCMQRMRFFEDDKQISDVQIKKRYSPTPGYYVELHAWGDSV